MGNHGIKVSKEGVDVRTASDNDLSFSSAFNSLKISSEALTTLLVTNGTTGTKTIAHGLGYAPSHLVFVKELNYGGNDFWVGEGMGVFGLPIYDPSSATTSNTSLGDSSWFASYTDSTNLKIDISNSSGADKTYSIYYYILIEDNG